MATMTPKPNRERSGRGNPLWLSPRWGKLAGYLAVYTVGFFFVFPALWMFFTAFKSDKDVFRIPPKLLPYAPAEVVVDGQTLPLYDVPLETSTRRLALLSFAEGRGQFVDPANPGEIIEAKMRIAEPVFVVKFLWRNFLDAMNRGVRPGLNVNFWTYLKNSLIFAGLAIVGTLLSCAPVAYGFSRVRWPGRDVVFVLVLSTMMLPYQVTMIPLFILFNDVLKWSNTLLPLVVPTFFANPYDIFLLRQFFRGIPQDYTDAARVDGASEFQIFTRIILPLSTPVIATIAVFTFLWAWNSFLEPSLYLTNPENFTLAQGLQDFQGQRTVAWNLLMAASVVFTLPIIVAFFFAQRTFIEGIKLTGTKG